MEYDLHITDRLNILQLLPKEGNFLTLKSVRIARESLALTPEEIKKYEVVQKDNQIHWNVDKATELKKIKIDNIIIDLIKKELRSLDEANKLQEQHFNLYKLFIGD